MFIFEMEFKTGATEPDFFVVGPFTIGVGRDVAEIAAFGCFVLGNFTDDERVDFLQLLVELPQVKYSLFATTHHLSGRPQRLQHEILLPLSLQLQPPSLQFIFQGRLNNPFQHPLTIITEIIKPNLIVIISKKIPSLLGEAVLSFVWPSVPAV